MSGSGDDPQYKKQYQSIQQDRTAVAPACQSPEFDPVRTAGFRFVVPVIIIESFIIGPSAH